MPINETCPVSVTLEADQLAPAFLPLLDVERGSILIPNQSSLAVTGAPLPLEVAMMLCKPGTPLGAPGDAVLTQGDVFNVETDQPHVLEGNVPPLTQGGVLGLYVPVALLTAGVKIEGFMNIVH